MPTGRPNSGLSSHFSLGRTALVVVPHLCWAGCVGWNRLPYQIYRTFIVWHYKGIDVVINAVVSSNRSSNVFLNIRSVVVATHFKFHRCSKRMGSSSFFLKVWSCWPQKIFWESAIITSECRYGRKVFVYFDGGCQASSCCIMRDRWKNSKDRFVLKNTLKHTAQEHTACTLNSEFQSHCDAPIEWERSGKLPTLVIWTQCDAAVCQTRCGPWLLETETPSWH